jgi:hypothetical protein
MATWRGRYPVPADDTATGYRRLDGRLFFSPATRFCPECLAGDGSALQESFGAPWLKAWNLPVVFACPVHQRFLEHCCPDCGNVARHGRWPRRTSAVLPAMWTAGLHPASSTLVKDSTGLGVSFGGRSRAMGSGMLMHRAVFLPWSEDRCPVVNGSLR